MARSKGRGKGWSKQNKENFFEPQVARISRSIMHMIFLDKTEEEEERTRQRSMILFKVPLKDWNVFYKAFQKGKVRGEDLKGTSVSLYKDGKKSFLYLAGFKTRINSNLARLVLAKGVRKEPAEALC